MTNEMTKIEGEKALVNASVRAEMEAIAKVAQEEGGFEQLLKFKKGIGPGGAAGYECGTDDDGRPKLIPMGTELIAHMTGWTRCWIKFIDGQVADRKMYPVADKSKRPPDREELDEKDESKWPFMPGTQQRSDPWVYQHLVPMEDRSGEMQVMFVTSSMGGRQALGDLGKGFTRRYGRTGIVALPVIKLSMAMMPTKAWGDVPRPSFEIVGWEENIEGIRNVKAPDTLKQEHSFDDTIPF